MVAALAEVLWDQLKAQRTYIGKSQGQQPFNSRSMDDLIAFLDGPKMDGDDSFVCVLIHNIDGPGLRDPDTQQYLARISACSHIRIIASIDHVNAPLCKYYILVIVYLIERPNIRYSLNNSSHYNYYFIYLLLFFLLLLISFHLLHLWTIQQW